MRGSAVVVVVVAIVVVAAVVVVVAIVVVAAVVVVVAIVVVAAVVATFEHPTVFDTSSQTGSLQEPPVSFSATQKNAPPLQE